MSLPPCKPFGNMPDYFASRNYFWTVSRGRLRSEDSRLRSVAALERLYLVAAIAILYATTQGMAVQIAFLTPTVSF